MAKFTIEIPDEQIAVAKCSRRVRDGDLTAFFQRHCENHMQTLAKDAESEISRLLMDGECEKKDVQDVWEAVQSLKEKDQ